MKRILLATFICFTSATFAQTVIEGNRLLDLIGKKVDDPLFRELKTQENFYTNSWDEKFTIYISSTKDTITDLELQNGKIKYGSTDRYGKYAKRLPLNLSWNMPALEFEKVFGAPVLVSTKMQFSDYQYADWDIRIFYENTFPVSINFKKGKSVNGAPKVAPKIETPPSTAVAPKTASEQWLIRVDTNVATASINFPALQQVLLSTKDMKLLTGNDSTDYMSQMYYSTPYKAIGFNRTALKRTKKTGVWKYEAFLRMSGDSNRARRVFFSIYDALKKSIDENTGTDFIHTASAKSFISDDPMSWLTQWGLYSGYKGFVPGLGKVTINFVLTGMTNPFKNKLLEYTFKLYVYHGEPSIDFFTWDQPRE